MSMAAGSRQATWAAWLTPVIPAAIATIAIRGPLASEIVAAAFRTPDGRRPQLELAEARFGHWTVASRDVPAEHVVLCRTGDAEFEIYCHGGLAICRLILSQVERCGCQICDADDWVAAGTKALEASAERALERAATLKVAAILLDQAQGALRRALARVDDLLTASRIDQARHTLSQLLERSALGMRLLLPWQLTLAGPPNAGKSSLTNALVGSSRVLVHEEPGTTRDAVDTAIVVSSWPLVITDTAGVRAAGDAIERQGIDMARRRWQQADIGLLVVDATVGWSQVHDDLLAERHDRSTLVVLNKRDLARDYRPPERAVQSVVGLLGCDGPVAVISTEATRADGIKELVTVLGEHFDGLTPPAGSAVPFLREQARALTGALAALEEDRYSEARDLITRLLDAPPEAAPT